MPQTCPSCGSKYIGTFGLGTEQVEQMAASRFPGARVLRMDADTTGGKEGHDRILKQFVAGEADILVGTQMIVKGHDFAKVTLVGILAADLSLNVGDYRAAERTYQLLAAGGRTGRTWRSCPEKLSCRPISRSITALPAQQIKTTCNFISRKF